MIQESANASLQDENNLDNSGKQDDNRCKRKETYHHKQTSYLGYWSYSILPVNALIAYKLRGAGLSTPRVETESSLTYCF